MTYYHYFVESIILLSVKMNLTDKKLYSEARYIYLLLFNLYLPRSNKCNESATIKSSTMSIGNSTNGVSCTW